MMLSSNTTDDVEKSLIDSKHEFYNNSGRLDVEDKCEEGEVGGGRVDVSNIDLSNKLVANLEFENKEEDLINLTPKLSNMMIGEANEDIRDDLTLNDTSSLIVNDDVSSKDDPKSVLTYQSSQSQVVMLYGSREQCSLAVMEILAICFKESKHRGFSNPCLGLLVDKSIYVCLAMLGGGSMTKSRKYFDAIQNTTGARISVTK